MNQAVTETKPAEDQTVEEQGAQDELDSLLEEFTEETKPTEQPNDEISEVVNWAKQQQQKEAKQTDDNDLNSAMESIKGSLDDIGFTPTDGMIHGMMQHIASKDPKIQEAFTKRFQNPRAWDEAVKRLTHSIKEDLSIDQKATSDREALASAVRNASTKQPTQEEAPDLNSMSDTDFANFKMGLLRKG